ncbi:hypothetical protein C9J40_13290 [Photobacterium sp. GB-72]|nr:hypothetical protein C9J40_13290 [Photobacterium sp. GB-72]
MVLLTINIILTNFFSVHIPIELMFVLIGAATILPALMINHIVSQIDNVQKACNYIEIDKADRKEKVFFIGAIYFITPIIPLLLIVGLVIGLKYGFYF